MKKFLNNYYEKYLKKYDEKFIFPIRDFYNKHLNYGIINCIFLALVLDLYIETVSRGSLKGLILFIQENPFAFLYNGLIILATLSIGLLVKRRVFLYFVVSSIWLILGTTNGVILSFRMTPFTVADLSLMETGLGVLPNYFSNMELMGLGAGIILLLILYLLLFLFAPKCKNYSLKKSVFVILIVVLSLTGSTQLGLRQNWLSTVFGNLGYAYDDYGFPYCFINTWLNTGVGLPSEYSKEKMAQILQEGQQDTATSTSGLLSQEKRTPNIVIVQLESFFDPTLIKGLEVSEDPIPNFHALQKKYSTGYLMVPSIGAGTANTELEVLSGMRVRFFGPGEYPYKTVLKDHTTETIAYNLKELGYSTHAIHNHRGVFYGRNEVYPNLGFDSFTSLEYMANAEMNPRKWAKDKVLTEEIMTALNSTEQKDLVFTVSVQGHGKYPGKKVYNDPTITVGGIENKADAYAYEYYVNQIYEMDQFIKELTDTLSEYDEDVVLVLYGDHLPSLEISNEILKNGDVYETEYVIWSNFRMRKIDTDLKSYQLSATVLGRLGINNGVLTKFHQTQQGKASYLLDLKALQYDMLYGKQYVYNGDVPYERIDMRMGIKNIRITDAFTIENHVYIKGENFTPYSVLTIDGELIDTTYLDTKTLRVPDGTDISNLSKLKISQVEKYSTVLSTTE
ncbi:LTA synthase family protein [Anaerovorax sp. IOR16]|uniref:LTA synthase family protein n=1 Tax=Anaerovorax sp. IOR16 TaxID=2773458 RepID=UPI0019D07BF2|nr:LTA synthase family protein [Anaerovorax sp. IOR16]